MKNTCSEWTVLGIFSFLRYAKVKYYLSFECWNKDCLSNETKRIFTVMIYCYFCTLPNLSVTELTNNTIKTSVFSLKVICVWQALNYSNLICLI